MDRTILEMSRKTSVSGDYDVVVVGGGIAGVAAAVSAKRNGASVCIIEKENAFGGLATLGLVVIYLPLCDGMGNQVAAGMAEELLKLSILYGPGKLPDCWLNKISSSKERKEIRYKLEFNAASFIIALDELIIDNDIDCYFDTRFCDVIVENDRIEYVLIENKSGRSALKCKTVVDASGDADVCFTAGEETVSLNTNRKSGWFYSYNYNDLVLHKTQDPIDKDLPKGVKTYAGDNAADVTEMSIQGRKMILEKTNSLKKMPDNKRIFPLLIPSIPLLRMTRRLRSTYELDENDNKINFSDTVGIIGDWRKPDTILFIPYRSICPVKIKNMLVCGRCISVKTDAWDIIRSIPGCAVTGQAAGTAAAISSAKKADVQDLNINELQKTLTRQNAILNPEFL